MFLKSSYNAITTTMAPYHMISFRLICTSDVLVDISYLITRWMGIFRKNRKQAWLDHYEVIAISYKMVSELQNHYLPLSIIHWCNGFNQVKKNNKIGIYCFTAKTGQLEIRIMCPSGETYLPTDCCFSELALYKYNWACWTSTKWTSSSFHRM